MKETNGLLYRENLMLGIDELQWLQAENNEQAQRWMIHQTKRAGLLIDRYWNGDLDPRWAVLSDAAFSAGAIRLRQSPREMGGPDYPAGLLLVNEEGTVGVHRLPEDWEILVVPDDGVWYTLVCRVATVTTEPGTIETTTGSTTITGTNTTFTRFAAYTDDGYARGSRIEIAGSANGNDGIYEIDTVVSDTELTLRTAPPGTTEAELPFSIAGRFLAGTTPADYDIHQQPAVEFELVTRTRVPAAGDFVLADVKYDSGSASTVAVIDRRMRNTWLPRYRRPQRHGLEIVPKMEFVGVYPHDVATRERNVVYALADVTYVAASTIQDSPDVLVLVTRDATDILTFTHSALTGSGTAGGTVDATGTAEGVALVTTPSASGQTHWAFYVAGGQLYRRGSDDNGASWSSAVLTWNPQTVDPSDTVANPAAILLLNGRIIVLCEYYDDSIPHTQLRYIYSDDYGTTWVTASNAGTVWVSESLLGTTYDSRRPSIHQSEDGQIVTSWSSQDSSGPGWPQVRVLYSGSSDALAYNPDYISAGRKGVQVGESQSTTYCNTACVADSNGNALTVYARLNTQWSSYRYEVMASTAAWNQYHNRQLFRVYDDSVPGFFPALAVLPLRTNCMVFYTDGGASPCTLFATMCSLVPTVAEAGPVGRW